MTNQDKLKWSNWYWRIAHITVVISIIFVWAMAITNQFVYGAIGIPIAFTAAACQFRSLRLYQAIKPVGEENERTNA